MSLWFFEDVDFDHEKADEAERDDWDPSLHWFDRPDFGVYESLLVPDLLERAWPGVAPLPWVGA